MYDPETETMAIMGTHDVQDIITDIVSVPTGTITAANRYTSAVNLYRQTKPKKYWSLTWGIFG